jgi:acetylornithine/LysW-gamma-L-lysine aminotransferase
MDTKAIIELEDAHSLGVYPKRPLAIARAKGARLWDAEGRGYLDLGASYSVCNIGHCNDEVIAAVREQLERLLYISPTFYNEIRARFQERLVSIAPKGMDRTFLCCSGTEAVEAAFKLARGHTSRHGIVSCKRAYHGRSMGALSATWEPKYREPFAPLVPDHEFVAFGDLEAAKVAIGKGTAAFIVEPVQGESGVYPAPSGYLKGLRDICTDTGALLIADEIQTGLGRTGRMFAVEHDGVVPDIITVAKSMAGGLPMGAIIARSEVCTLPKMAHGATFSGNPVTCAAGIATLEYITKNKLPERSAELGAHFMGRLRDVAVRTGKIREVRGRGLMVGIELKSKAGPFLSALLDKGYIALPAGSTVMRFLPPLVIEKDDLDSFTVALGEVMSDGQG